MIPQTIPDEVIKAVAGVFLSRIEKTDTCWLWTGATDRSGYGRFPVKLPGRSHHVPRLAHRIMWQLTYGELPSDAHVLHRCDNPPCVNPEHLFLGTHQDNMDDAWKKGRFDTPAFRAIRDVHVGKIVSAETRAKASASIVAVLAKRTPEQKQLQLERFRATLAAKKSGRHEDDLFS